MHRIIVTAGEVALQAELNDSPTARLVWEALPIEAAADTWGDEIYFGIPVDAQQAHDARAAVEVGEIGYWPLGHAFCVFFGPTPASTGVSPRAYSPVNVIGRVTGDATRLRGVADGARVTVTAAEET